MIVEQLQRWDTIMAYKNAAGNTKTIMDLKQEAMNDNNLDISVFTLMEHHTNSSIYEKMYLTSTLSEAMLEAQDRLILRTGQYIKDQIDHSWDLTHRDIHFILPSDNSTWIEKYRNLVPSYGECASFPIGQTQNTP